MQKNLVMWRGGKSRLVKKLLPLIPDHTCYVEAFAGAAWLLFAKEKSKVEVINDRHKELINLYRVVQHHPEELTKWCLNMPQSRDIFDGLKGMTEGCLDSITDIQRAARFLYLTRVGYGSRMNFSYGYRTGCHPGWNLQVIEEKIKSFCARVARVNIENLDFREIIKRYDRPHTFFYLDPPYYGHEDDYGPGLFKRSDYGDLAKLLKNAEGKFLMSINDKPEIREIFKEFKINSVETKYSSKKECTEKGGPIRELLISNYRLP